MEIKKSLKRSYHIELILSNEIHLYFNLIFKNYSLRKTNETKENGKNQQYGKELDCCQKRYHYS